MSEMFHYGDARVREYRNRLRRMRRYDLPIVIRRTLDRTAFYMRKGTMPAVYERNFIVRRPKFLNSHASITRVKTSEWNIGKMKATVGLIKGKSIAGDRLAFQERGGTVNSKEIPDDNTRVSENKHNKQRAKYYYRKFKNMPNGRSGSRRQKFNYYKSRKAIIEYQKGKRQGRIIFLLNRSVTIKKNPFLKPAGKLASRKTPVFFNQEARRRINR